MGSSGTSTRLTTAGLSCSFMPRVPFMNNLNGSMRTCQNRFLNWEPSHMFTVRYRDIEDPVIREG